MKFLRNTFDSLYKKVPHKWHPAIDTIDTFFYTPNHVTKSGSHLRDGIDLKRTMMTVIIALVPCLLFGMWNVGQQSLGGDLGDDLVGKFLFGAWYVLPLVLVTYAAGLGIEFIFAVKHGHGLHEGFLVSGLLIPLIMPIGTPLWMVALATIFAVLIGKEIFGGTGMNIINIALTARAFLFFAYPTMMSGDKVWALTPDGSTKATALGDLATTVGVDKADAGVVEVMSMFNVDGTYSLWNSFIGAIPGSIGETSAIACLIGAAYLIWTGIASWRIIVSMFIGGLVMSSIFNLFAANAFMELSPIHQLMIGGFMFGMVFMATDPVTAAQTNTGKIIYGFFAGFFAILIRVFNPAYPEGVMLAILFMNIMAPMIDHYVIQSNINRRLKRNKVKVA